MLYTIFGIIIIIIDQAVKLYVSKNILFGNVKELIPNVMTLVRVQNDGAAFSFLAGGGARIWFIVLTLIFVALVLIALVTNFISGKFGRWCMVMVAAGGLSNCIDRVLYGYVVDMFRVDLFDFAVFNVADIFITVGCIAFILYILFGGEKTPSPDADEYDEEDEEDLDRPVREPLFKKKRPAYYDEDDDDEDDDDDEEDEYLNKKLNKSAMFSKKLAKESDKQTASKTKVPAKKDVPTTKTSYMEKDTSSSRSASYDSKQRAAEEAKAFEEFFKKRAESQKTTSPTTKQSVNTQTRNVVKTTERRTPIEKSSYDDAFADAFKTVEKPSRPVSEPVREKTQHTAVSSDDFDLDSILNEFK